MPPVHANRVLRWLFVALLVAGAAGGGALIGAAVAEDSAPEAPVAVDAVSADSTAAAHRVIAYYFHTTQRCASCRKIEAFTAEAITTGFVDELEDGRLVFEAVNIDEKENEHFVKDYKLFTKSVILVDERSGKQVSWKNLEKVWQLLNDKEKFLAYIRDETRGYLAGTQS